MPAGMAYLIVLVLSFSSAVILALTLFPNLDRLRALRRSRAGEAHRQVPPLLRLASPVLALVVPFAEGIKATAWRARTLERIKQAGLHGLITVDEMLALRILLTAGLPAVGLLYVSLIPWPLLILVALFGYFFPEMWLRDMAKLRQRKITKDLPFVLDLLTLSVEAGLDFTAALARVAERLKPGPTREEIETTINEFRIGSSRSDALRALAARVDTREMTSVTSALIQASEIGASIGQTLRQVAEIMRANRFQRAEKAGAEASQKMLIPLVVFIMPAVIVIVLGPVIIRFVYGGSF